MLDRTDVVLLIEGIDYKFFIKVAIDFVNRYLNLNFFKFELFYIVCNYKLMNLNSKVK